MVMTEAELAAFLARDFPQVRDDFAVERLTGDGIVMRLKVAERHLRPGGTVSGPSIFALADVAVYLAILARIGPVALAVTTSCRHRFPAQARGGGGPDRDRAAPEARPGAGGGRCPDPLRRAGRAGGARQHDLFDPAPPLRPR